MQFQHLVLSVAIISTTALADYTPPTGFRDIPWASSPNAVMGGMALVEDHGDMKCYTRKKESLKIGDADLKRIVYCYYKDRFFALTVKFSGATNFTKIQETLTQKFDEPLRPNRYMDKYWWGIGGSTVTIMLEYNDISKVGDFSYIYEPISAEQTKNEKQRATEATKDL